MLQSLSAFMLLAGPVDDLTDRACAAEERGDYTEASTLWIEAATHDEASETTSVEAVITAAGFANLVASETSNVEPLCASHKALELVSTRLSDEALAEALAETSSEVEARLLEYLGDDWPRRCSPEEKPTLVPTNAAASRPALLPVVLVEQTGDEPETTRPMIVAGATMTGVGVGLLGVMGATLYQWDRDSNKLEVLKENAIPGMVPERDKNRADELIARTRVLGPVAITTGVLGVASTITGISLLAVGSRRQRRISFLPTGGRDFAGALVTGRF